MGFRSTFVTEHYSRIALPPWFVEKWQDRVHFGEGGTLPLASRWEAKQYVTWCDLEQDLQRAFPWDASNAPGPVAILYFHECGGVTRAEIRRDAIRYIEPVQAEWEVVDEPTHSYCYGCSDPAQLAQ